MSCSRASAVALPTAWHTAHCGDFSQVAGKGILATCHSQDKVRIRKGVF